MIAVPQGVLPAEWQRVLERRAQPTQLQDLLIHAQRYLGLGSPDRVPDGMEAATLKNLLFVYFEPAEREATLYDLAVLSFARRDTQPLVASGVLGLGGLVLAAAALARRKR
jgi:hypothetical protein